MPSHRDLTDMLADSLDKLVTRKNSVEKLELERKATIEKLDHERQAALDMLDRKRNTLIGQLDKKLTDERSVMQNLQEAARDVRIELRKQLDELVPNLNPRG